MSTKCGCPDCKRQTVPRTRSQWQARKNKKGLSYGSFHNPTAKHGGGQAH